MRAAWVIGVVLGAASAHAQAPGFVELTVAALGSGAGGIGAAGDSRLPLRPRDVRDDNGTLRLRASGARGSVRDVELSVPASAVGSAVAVGEGATLRLTFASGQALEPRPGAGTVTLESWDGSAVRGAFDADLVQGRMTLHVHGRFEGAVGAR